MGVSSGFGTEKKTSETSRVNPAEILSGGPPKDGIPSIDHPLFDTVETTPFGKNEPILGILVESEARAYPYSILNWHEVVNDTIQGFPVSITYCPLCDTGIAFKRVIGNQKTSFGVSGKLFQSCLVMYDRATETLWSQPWGTGIQGEKTNGNLEKIPVVKTTLEQWIEKYPDTKILSTKTGYVRDYFSSPYGNYPKNSHLFFPVRNLDRLKGHAKEPVTIVWEADGSNPPNRFGGNSVQFVNSDVKEKKSLDGKLGDSRIRAVWDSDLETVRVYEVNPNEELGRELASTSAFAFVYPAFFR